MRLTKSTASTQFLNLKYLISFLSASTSHPSTWSCSGTIWSWVSGGVPPRQGTHLLSASLLAIQSRLPVWGRTGWGLSTLPIVARSASSGLVSNHASQISLATASGVARRLNTSTLASFQRRAPLAVSASAHSAARIPGTLLAAIETPVPVQQNRTPCWQAPGGTPPPPSPP